MLLLEEDLVRYVTLAVFFFRVERASCICLNESFKPQQTHLMTMDT